MNYTGLLDELSVIKDNVIIGQGYRIFYYDSSFDLKVEIIVVDFNGVELAPDWYVIVPLFNTDRLIVVNKDMRH